MLVILAGIINTCPYLLRIRTKKRGVISMKFKDLAWEWFEVKRKYLKESTKSFYMYELNTYILPYFGEIEIENITEEIIQNIVCKWQTENNKYGKEIKKSTISNIVMLIRQIIKYGNKKVLYHSLK